MEAKYPKVVVGCFIKNNKNEVLLVRSYKWPGLWVVMGGHVEWGESIEAAVIRETKEELGIGVIFDRVIEVAEFINDPTFHKFKHFVALQCECHLSDFTQTPHPDNNEIQECRWFSLDEALLLGDILPQTKKTLQKLSQFA